MPLPGQHPAADAAQWAREVVGDDVRLVGTAIVVGVFEPPDHLGFMAQGLFALGSKPFPDLGQAILHRA